MVGHHDPVVRPLGKGDHQVVVPAVRAPAPLRDQVGRGYPGPKADNIRKGQTRALIVGDQQTVTNIIVINSVPRLVRPAWLGGDAQFEMEGRAVGLTVKSPELEVHFARGGRNAAESPGGRVIAEPSRPSPFRGRTDQILQGVTVRVGKNRARNSKGKGLAGGQL